MTVPGPADAVVSHDAKAHQFYARLNGMSAMLQYRCAPGRIYFVYTEVPTALQGRGIADTLAQAGLECARTEHLAVVRNGGHGWTSMVPRRKRSPSRFGLSGGLIGPEGTPRDYAGTFGSTPVFHGCSDVDPHVPKRRVDETAIVLGRMGARVTKRIYPQMAHTVNADESEFVRSMLDAVTQ